MPLTMPSPSSSTGGNYTPIPADNHVGVCIGVIDLGTHSESYQGGPPKLNHKVKVQFELPGVERDDGTTAVISKVFNLSMHEKATFRKELEKWLGAKEVAELVGRGLDSLLERPALVNVEQVAAKEDPGRTISYIAGLSKLPKGLGNPTPTRDTFMLDLDGKFLPPELSIRDAEMIRASREYLAGGFTDEAPRPQAGGYQAPKVQPVGTSKAKPANRDMAEFDEIDNENGDA